MNFRDECIAWLLLVISLTAICTLLINLNGCQHRYPRCTMGVSDEAQAVCCEVYCKDKGMEYSAKARSKLNIEQLQCICIQPERPETTNHNGTHKVLF